MSWLGMLVVDCVLGVQGNPRLHLQEKQKKKTPPRNKGPGDVDLVATLDCILPEVRSPLSGEHCSVPPVFLFFLEVGSSSGNTVRELGSL